MQLRNNPRVLFTETTGHEDVINFMSSYQAQDRKGKHYHPRGYLCWYGCNQYGEMTGFIQPIKKVPEYVWIFDFKNKGYQRLKREKEVKPKLNELFAMDPRASPYEPSDVKGEYPQISNLQLKRRIKNARKEDRDK